MKKKEKKAGRHFKPQTPIVLKFDHVPAGAFQDGQIVKFVSETSIGIGRVSIGKSFRPCVKLLKLHKPRNVEGIEYRFALLFQKCGDTPAEVFETVSSRLIEGDQKKAQQVFDKVNADFAFRERQQEQECCKELSIEEKMVQDAQWKVLADCFHETVSAVLSGKEGGTEFAAEKFLVTGKIEDGTENIQGVVTGIVKWNRRKREIDRVKQELALGWLKKGYRDMGAELAVAVERSTGIKIPIKTLRSLASSLGLTSSSKVRSGPKEK